MIQLFNGDCLKIMSTLPPKSIDMVLCDLPYQMTANRWDVMIPFDELWKRYDRVCSDNAVIALFGSQPFSSLMVANNLKMFRHEWIWIKNRGSNFANTAREPMKEHEHILIFSKGKWTYNKQMQKRSANGAERAKYNVKFESKSDNYREFEPREKNDIGLLRVPSSWQKFNVENGLHPTQKPVGLCEYLIRTYTNEGDIVMDNCMGSGTTGIACINTNRNFVGIELDEKYFEAAKNRINSHSAQLSFGGM